MRKQDKPLKERFEDKILKLPMTDCHLWTAYTNPRGYGKISIDHSPQLAHRVSYQLYKGEIPSGMQVLHNCDNSYCVNPDHLRLGTHDENMRDHAIRGRRFKVSNPQLFKIREELSAGVRAKEIADKNNLPVWYIYMIKSNKTRKFV